MDKLTFSQQICIKKAGLALQRVSALWPGCRVGVAVSGGVDSFVLLKVMLLRQKITPFFFEIMALHINPGFDEFNHQTLLPWLSTNGVASHTEITNFGPRAHSAENKKRSPCFLCALWRRKRLFELCNKYRLTHLAFGHNADDLLSTFLLNFCRTGRVEGMRINTEFFHGNLRVIRPCLLVEKKFIHQAARQWKLPIWKNPCPSAGKTARSQAEDITLFINKQIPNGRRSMLNALARWELDKETAAAKVDS